MRVLGWIVVALLAWPVRAPAPDARPLATRLLGPVTTLAASAEWVRFDVAWADGRPERAMAHAERALELDPVSTQGWLALGRHLMFLQASAENEPDPRRRTERIRAGLDVLERGAATADDPYALADTRATTLMMFVAPLAADGVLPWEGGWRAAFEEARAILRPWAGRGEARAHASLSSLRALVVEFEAQSER